MKIDIKEIWKDINGYEGFITSYDDLIKYLRKQYANRHNPFLIKSYE